MNCKCDPLCCTVELTMSIQKLLWMCIQTYLIFVSIIKFNEKNINKNRKRFIVLKSVTFQETFYFDKGIKTCWEFRFKISNVSYMKRKTFMNL